MPRWTEPFSIAVVLPRANLMRVRMLVPCWARATIVIIRRRMDTIAELVKTLSQGLMPGFLNSDWIKRHVAEGGPGSPPLAGSEIQDSKFKVYRFGVACVAGMPFIGIG